MSAIQLTSILTTPAIDSIKKGLAAWEPIALTKGMTSEDVLRQNKFISRQLTTWLGDWAKAPPCTYIPAGAKSNEPARAVEFFVKDKKVTVITHLEQQGGQQPLGNGIQSLVTASLISLVVDFAQDKPPKPPTDLQPGSLIANKLPHTEDALPALIREGDIIAKFAGAKNIRQLLAKVQDRTNSKGLLLIGMKHTLAKFFGGSRGLTPAEKIAIAKDLTHGLHEMHTKNIVHRDLHMGNCGESIDGAWVIHDFGFACEEGETLDRRAQLCIPIASPTLLQRKVLNMPSTASFRDDAWALGLMLYEIDRRCLPSFVRSGRTTRLRVAIEKRDSIFQEINRLDPSQVKMIVEWDGISPLKLDSTSIKLAVQYRTEMRLLAKEYTEYTQDVALFIESLEDEDENPEYVLKDLILDLLEGKDSGACYERAKNLSHPDSASIKASESTEDLKAEEACPTRDVGYLNEEELSRIFPSE